MIVLTLQVRSDGTWDYRRAEHITKDMAIKVFRNVADQMEAGADIENPT